MSLYSKTLALVFASMILATVTPALADQADKDACIGFAEGDDCTDGNGRAGYCIPDESDPGVLTCEDLRSGGAGGSGGDDSSKQPVIACSTTPGVPAPLPLSLLAAATLAWGRRRARPR
ncbi:hypothetical protein [Polyangium sorediatum]|uniref:Uncharacterized protein n=1 Tax=Polyangium sorediatum TaxID=889274 RepID=A0ABT6NTY3_9BACT|nr:hypothetical protein [Polyangium sorediatum]MDI1431801.1 hypothetical protein [Polyangium sorediatum]